MSGEQYKPLPANHSDFAILLASFAGERAASVERMQEAARILDGLEGALLRSFLRGCAEQCREDADAAHRLARAFEALASESGAALEPPTKRDLEVTRRKRIMTTVQSIFASLAGGLTAAAAVAGLATGHPQVALWMLVGAAFCGGVVIPTGKKAVEPPKAP